MANRAATQADVDNTTYSNWIDAEVRYQYKGRTMQVGDFLYDTNEYIPDMYTDSKWNNAYTGAASGNNLNDTTFDVTTTISSQHPSEGVFIVSNGAGGWDFYHYSSYSGSIFTLDTTDHPTGLVRSYAGSDAVHASLLRIGFSIWIDAVALGMDINNPLATGRQFYFASHSNSSIAEAWKYISTRTKPVGVFPLRGPTVWLPSPSNGNRFYIAGIPHLYMGFLTTTYKGVKGLLTSNFAQKHFAYYSTSKKGDKSGHGFSWDSGHNSVEKPLLEINGGMELIGGFAGIRAEQGGQPEDLIETEIIIRGIYRHDAERGEGLYLGRTVSGEHPKLRFVVEDNIFMRCAAESIQVQDMVDHAGEGLFRNNIVIASGTDMYQPFQAFQDNAWQTKHGDGNVLFQKNITIGWGGGGLHIQGSSLGSGLGRIRWKDNLFIGGRTWVYFHNSLNGLTGLSFEFTRFRLLNYSDPKKELLRDSPETALIKTNHVTGRPAIKAQSVTKETSNTLNLWETESHADIIGSRTEDLPLPQFKNLGLDYLSVDANDVSTAYLSRFHHWYEPVQSQVIDVTQITNNGSGEMRVQMQQDHDFVNGDSVLVNGAANAAHNGYFAGAVVVVNNNTYDIAGSTFVANETGGDVAEAARPAKFKTGQIVSFDHSTDEVAFYKCTSDYEVNAWDGQDPEIDTVHWTRLQWDSAGVRSDEAGYNGTPFSTFPPDNVHLVLDDYWLLQGYGLLDNPTKHTKHKIQYSPDNTNWIDIPIVDALGLKFVPEIQGYYRAQVTINNTTTYTSSVFLYGEDSSLNGNLSTSSSTSATLQSTGKLQASISTSTVLTGNIYTVSEILGNIATDTTSSATLQALAKLEASISTSTALSLDNGSELRPGRVSNKFAIPEISKLVAKFDDQLPLQLSLDKKNIISEPLKGWTQTRSIQPKRCYQFDGVDDHIVIGATPETEILSFIFTAYIKIDSLTNDIILFGNNFQTDTDTSGFILRLQENIASGKYLLYIIRGNFSGQGFGAQGGLTPGVGYQLMVTMDSNWVTTLYLNGESVASFSYITPYEYNTSMAKGTSIGAYLSSSIYTGYDSGTAYKLNSVRFMPYSTANRDALLKDFYTEDLTGVLLKYNCDESIGSIAYDSSGNEYHGTIKNYTASTFHYEGSDVPYSYQNSIGFSDIDVKWDYSKGDTSLWGTSSATGVTISNSNQTFSLTAGGNVYLTHLYDVNRSGEITIEYEVTRYVSGNLQIRIMGINTNYGIFGLPYNTTGPTTVGTHTVTINDDLSVDISEGTAGKGLVLYCYNTPDYDLTIKKVTVKSKFPRTHNSILNINGDRCNRPGAARQLLRIKDVNTLQYQGTGQRVDIPTIWLDNTLTVVEMVVTPKTVQDHGLIGGGTGSTKPYILSTGEVGWLNITPTYTPAVRQTLIDNGSHKVRIEIDNSSTTETKRIYVNDILEFEAVGTTNLTTDFTALGIRTTASGFFEGLMSDVKIQQNGIVIRDYSEGCNVGEGVEVYDKVTGRDFAKGYTLDTPITWDSDYRGNGLIMTFYVTSTGTGENMFLTGGSGSNIYLYIATDGMIHSTSEVFAPNGTYNLLDGERHSVSIRISYSSTGSPFVNISIDGVTEVQTTSVFYFQYNYVNFSTITEIGQRNAAGDFPFKGILEDLNIRTSYDRLNIVFSLVHTMPSKERGLWVNHTNPTQWGKSDSVQDYLFQTTTYQHRYFDKYSYMLLNNSFTISDSVNRSVKVRFKFFDDSSAPKLWIANQTQFQNYIIFRRDEVHIRSGGFDTVILSYDVGVILVEDQFYEIELIRNNNVLSCKIDGVLQAETNSGTNAGVDLVLDKIGGSTSHTVDDASWPWTDGIVLDWVEFHDYDAGTVRRIVQTDNTFIENGVEAVSKYWEKGGKSFMDRCPVNTAPDYTISATPYIHEVRPLELNKTARSSFKLDPHYYKALPESLPNDLNDNTGTSTNMIKQTTDGINRKILISDEDISTNQRLLNYTGN